MSAAELKPSRPVIVLGAGGHARVLIDCLKLVGAEILGLTCIEAHTAGAKIDQVAVLGDDNALDKFDPARVFLVNGVGGIGSTLRKKIFCDLTNRGFEFAKVVHPSAIISAAAKIEVGAQIMAGVVLQTGCSIGVNAIINTRATVDHDCQIGDHVHVAPGCILSGNVTVDQSAHLGTGAVIIQGLRIGSQALIAAGAVVTTDVADNQKVAGVPARAI